MAKDWVVMDRWIDGERMKKRGRENGNETRCGIEEGKEGPAVTGKKCNRR